MDATVATHIFFGPSAAPQSVSFSDLVELFLPIERAIQAHAREMGGAWPADVPALPLVAITENCLRVEFGLPFSDIVAQGAARAVHDAIADDYYEGIGTDARASLREFRREVALRGWRGRFAMSWRESEQEVDFGATQPAPQPVESKERGIASETCVIGSLRRANLDSLNFGSLLVANGRLYTLHVHGGAQRNDWSQYISRRVVIHGEAEYDADGEITGPILVSRMVPAEADPAAFVSVIRAAAGDQFPGWLVDEISEAVEDGR